MIQSVGALVRVRQKDLSELHSVLTCDPNSLPVGRGSNEWPSHTNTQFVEICIGEARPLNTVSDSASYAIYHAYAFTSDDKLHDVVVKLALPNVGTRGIDELTHEAKAYCQLWDLQGDIIPKFYGIYRTSIPVKGVARSSSQWCTILSYCGTRIRALTESKLSVIRNIGQHLRRIHALGVSHDLDEEPIFLNVLEDNGKITLIDFHRANLAHDCKLAKEIHLSDPAPSVKSGCREILSFLHRVNAFAEPESWECYNTQYPFSDDEEYFVAERPSWMSEETARPWAKEAAMRATAYINEWKRRDDLPLISSSD